jgi:hypothetical protein
MVQLDYQNLLTMNTTASMGLAETQYVALLTCGTWNEGGDGLFYPKGCIVISMSQARLLSLHFCWNLVKNTIIVYHHFQFLVSDQ